MTVTSQREVSHRAYPVLPCWCLFTVFTLLCFLIYWEKKWKQFVSLDPRFGDFRCVPPDWTLFLDIDIYFWNFPLAFAISISFGVLSLSLVWDLIKKKIWFFRGMPFLHIYEFSGLSSVSDFWFHVVKVEGAWRELHHKCSGRKSTWVVKCLSGFSFPCLFRGGVVRLYPFLFFWPQLAVEF